MKKHPQPLEEMEKQGATTKEALAALDLFDALRPGLKVKRNGRIDMEGGDKTPLGLFRSIVRVVDRHPLEDVKPVGLKLEKQTTAYIAARESLKELQALIAALRGEELENVKSKLIELNESLTF